MRGFTSMKSITPFRAWSIVALFLVALVAAACGSIEPSPTSPSPNPTPTPAPGPAGSGGGKLEVTINPNPVPWSGTPIEGSCAGVANTWFYTQTLKNTGGNTIVVSDRTNYFNDREVSKQSGLGITLEPGAQTNLPQTRWCSSSSGPHIAQTNFGATDIKTNTVITAIGPRVTLRAK